MRAFKWWLLLWLISGPVLGQNPDELGPAQMSVADRDEAAPSRAGCSDNLGSISEAIDRYRSDHDTRCPTTLAELSPDYLWWVSQCPYVSNAGCYPDYFVTADRKWYGLCCPADHKQVDSHSGAGSAVGFNGHEFVWNGYDPLDPCMEDLRREATAVKQRIRASGRLPADLTGTAGTSRCAVGHQLVARADGSFQIVCTSMRHLGLGVAPMQPLFDSVTDSTSAKRLAPFRPEPHETLASSLTLSASVCFLTLLGLRIRRRRRARMPRLSDSVGADL